MRWITFVILLYVMAGLASAQFLGLPHSGTFLSSPRIEYVLILVIFYSLFGDENLAPILALACGFTLDIINVDDVFGIRAMAAGLMSVAIIKIRLSIFREQILSQAIVTFLAVMLFAVVTGLLLMFAPTQTARAATTLPGDVGGGGGQMGLFRYLGLMTGNALYTGAFSPAFYWVLLKMRGMLGIPIQTKRGR
jgi:rod shape-determining protein MreD